MDVLIPFQKISVLTAIFVVASSCTTLPKVVHEKHKFPRGAYVGTPGRPYKKLGLVKTKILYPTLDVDSDERVLCKIYYNKAVKDLLKRAHEVKADAVIDVHSAVFMIDGRSEVFQTPECSDDGQEGQVLVEGIAIRWKSEKEMSSDEKNQFAEWKKSPKWSQPPTNGFLLETTAANSKPMKRSEESGAHASEGAKGVEDAGVTETPEVKENEGHFSGYTEEAAPLKAAPLTPPPLAAAPVPSPEIPQAELSAPEKNPASRVNPEEETSPVVRKAKRRQTLVRPNGPLLR